MLAETFIKYLANRVWHTLLFNLLHRQYILTIHGKTILLLADSVINHANWFPSDCGLVHFHVDGDDLPYCLFLRDIQDMTMLRTYHKKLTEYARSTNSDQESSLQDPGSLQELWRIKRSKLGTNVLQNDDMCEIMSKYISTILILFGEIGLAQNSKTLRDFQIAQGCQEAVLPPSQSAPATIGRSSIGRKSASSSQLSAPLADPRNNIINVRDLFAVSRV